MNEILPQFLQHEDIADPARARCAKDECSKLLGIAQSQRKLEFDSFSCRLEKQCKAAAFIDVGSMEQRIQPSWRRYGASTTINHYPPNVV